MGAASNIQTEIAAWNCRRFRRILLLVGSTDNHLLFAPKPSAPARGSGGYRLTPIRFTTRHHGPD
ncbi:hypothetical protein, partial [Acidiphilium multivorum]|uniref:hypothetical protein n=1 Tax=Acidiphilium multivorum TaxID=62140 RepID=UPI001F33152E